MTTYDVAFSFAGEQRNYVHKVASALRKADVSIFYDRFEVDRLWGKDLALELDRIYRKDSTFVVIFVSAEYAEKKWTRHEYRSALSSAVERQSEYVLPVRFDSTDLDGLPPSTTYIDANQVRPTELARLLLRKLRALTPLPIPTIDLWRIVPRQYSAHPFSPLPATRFGGRWSHPGHPVVYAAASICVAVLETSLHQGPVHARSGAFLGVGAKLKLSSQPTRLSASELPQMWSAHPPGRPTMDIGTKWLLSKASAVLLLPSVALPSENVALLNPAHPDFATLTVFSEEPVQIYGL